MNFKKMYVLIGSDVSVFEIKDETNKIIQDTFLRESRQGSAAGKVFEDAVKRNVDIETDAV